MNNINLNESQLVEYKKYFVALIATAKRSIAEGTFIIGSAHSYLRHLPKKGIHEGWPEEIYALSDKCRSIVEEWLSKESSLEG